VAASAVVGAAGLGLAPASPVWPAQYLGRPVGGGRARAASTRRISLTVSGISSWSSGIGGRCPQVLGPLFSGSGGGQVGVGGHGQGDVPVPGVIVAGLVVVQASLVFGGRWYELSLATGHASHRHAKAPPARDRPGSRAGGVAAGGDWFGRL